MIHYIDHTADAGFEIDAPDLNSHFSQAGYAMLDMLYDRSAIIKKQSRKIEITAAATDILLHDFIAELLQISQHEYFLISTIDIIHIDDRSLHAKIEGEPINPKVHSFLTEIKAVTYHQLTAEPRGNKWFARIIFDI